MVMNHLNKEKVSLIVPVYITDTYKGPCLFRILRTLTNPVYQY